MTTSDYSQSFDWKALWQELDGTNDDERREAYFRERLRQRAEQYARPAASTDTTPLYTVLVFDLGGEQYGVDVVRVRSVRPVGTISPVPGTPAFYPGVVNIRGQIITVIDLRLFFNIDASASQPPDELVVVRGSRLELGLLAHHVRGVTAIASDQLESIEDVRYARGVTPGGLVLLDINRMLEDDRLVIGGADD
ncbi:MAG: chemotaxis protein CheW [Phototrophicaceae bacterium]